MSKTRIIDAVRKLDLETTRKLLDADPALLTVKNHQGRNLLHLACGASGVKLKKPAAAGVRLVKLLLDRGMNIEEEGLSGRDPCKPIWFAVAFGRNPAVVKLLIERGAVPTGLFAAGWWDDTRLLDLLIRAGAPIDEVVGATPFLSCWRWRRFKAAKFLVLKGADVNYRDAKGRTALHHGVEQDFDPALLKWLVRHGALPDIEDRDGVSPRLRAGRKREKKFLAALGESARPA
jgi:hypothetical protein